MLAKSDAFEPAPEFLAASVKRNIAERFLGDEQGTQPAHLAAVTTTDVDVEGQFS
jgi:hypothetical protein